MKRFLLSIIYLYLAGMLVAQTAPLEILPYPNEVKVHPGHYPFMSCQLVYPNALKNEADYLKQLLLEEHGLIVQHTKQGNMQLTLLRFSGILGCSLNFIYAAACDFSRVPVFS